MRSRWPADGAAALDLMLARPPYDLVVLDVMLPRRDGFEVLKALRGPEACRRRCCCSPRATAWPTRSPASTAAPTTTSPSRLRSTSSWRGCARSCAGPAGQRAPVLRSLDLTLDPATREVTRGAPAHHADRARVRAARVLPPQYRARAHAPDARRARVGPRLRPREQYRRRLRRLPPAQDRRRRRAAAAAHACAAPGYVLRTERMRLPPGLRTDPDAAHSLVHGPPPRHPPADRLALLLRAGVEPAPGHGRVAGHGGPGDHGTPPTRASAARSAGDAAARAARAPRSTTSSSSSSIPRDSRQPLGPRCAAARCRSRRRRGPTRAAASARFETLMLRAASGCGSSPCRS